MRAPRGFDRGDPPPSPLHPYLQSTKRPSLSVITAIARTPTLGLLSACLDPFLTKRRYVRRQSAKSWSGFDSRQSLRDSRLPRSLSVRGKGGRQSAELRRATEMLTRMNSKSPAFVLIIHLEDDGNSVLRVRSTRMPVARWQHATERVGASDTANTRTCEAVRIGRFYAMSRTAKARGGRLSHLFFTHQSPYSWYNPSSHSLKY